MLENKVYIIEYDLVSPIGIGKDTLIESIKSDLTADQLITNINTNGIPFKRGAEIKEDLTERYKDESESIKLTCKADRKLELLVACYGLMKNRIVNLTPLFKTDETGVILGVGADSIQFELFEKHKSYANNDNPILEVLTQINQNKEQLNITSNAYDIYSIYLAQKFNAGVFQKSILTACTSSTQAIGLASDAIRNGEVEVVITGGTDSLINHLALIAFGKLGVIHESNQNKSCLPFDLKRNGTLAGESAGIVIMASENFIRKNNIKPIAQFMGYGNTIDGYKITAPDPDGTSMTQAINDAMTQSGLTVNDIDYINAHGTGTKHNDQLELDSFENALGKEVKKIPISSTKDRHGHAIAAAGVQEVCLMLELMKHKIIPKNLNLTSPCDDTFNLVKENISKPIKYGISSNFAFGGINTVLIIKNEIN